MTENNLRKIRLEKGLSQLQLSYLVEISPQAISNIENGKIFVYDGWKKRLAAALEVTEVELFPDNEDKEVER